MSLKIAHNNAAMFGAPRNYIPFSLRLSLSISIYVIGVAVELP